MDTKVQIEWIDSEGITPQTCEALLRGMDGIIVPGGFGVRFDSHAYPGYVVSPYYDSMIGKLLVNAGTREEGLAIMLRALDEFEVQGIKTSVPLLLRILRSQEFKDHIPDVGFIERYFMKK